MFTWLKRRVAAPAPRPVGKSASASVRAQAKSGASRADNALRHAPRFLDTAPLPEVVGEGNTQADWSMWEDSVMALDSQMQEMVPSNRVYVRESTPSQFAPMSQLDDVDAFASVRGKRDI